MRFTGWANLNGANGFSFGVFHENQPQNLDPEHELFETLRQGTQILLDKTDKGFVCGKEIHVQTTGKGMRYVSLESPWGKATIYERFGRDGFSLAVELPFGDNNGPAGPSVGGAV